MNKSILKIVAVSAVAVMFSVGCSNPDGGDGNGTDETKINPSDTIPAVDTIPTTPVVIDSTYPEFKQYMGDVFLIYYPDMQVDKNTDTIGWAKLYTRNGWNQYATEAVIEFPNGYRHLASTSKGISEPDSKNFIKISYRFDGDIAGYDCAEGGMYSVPGMWREPNLGKKAAEPEIESK